MRDWRVGHLISALRRQGHGRRDHRHLVDERGTSSTCPSCARRVPKPAGRNFRCPHCGHGGHRDLVAAANIAARRPGGGTIPAIPPAAGITHRRAGAHLPGVHPARRDPSRRPSSRPTPRAPGRHWPAPAGTRQPGSRSPPTRGARKHAGQPTRRTYGQVHLGEPAQSSATAGCARRSVITRKSRAQGRGGSRKRAGKVLKSCWRPACSALIQVRDGGRRGKRSWCNEGNASVGPLPGPARGAGSGRWRFGERRPGSAGGPAGAVGAVGTEPIALASPSPAQPFR